MAENPDDPLQPPVDPFDAPLPFSPAADPLRGPVVSSPPAMDDRKAAPLEPGAPAPPAHDEAPSPHPVSLAPESVRHRAAADLPFSLGPGGFGGGVGSADEGEGTEGIPTGLPDLLSLAGVPVSDSPEASTPPAAVLPETLGADASPPPGPEEEGADDEPDEVVLGHGLHDDETEQEQLPPTPIGSMRRDGPEMVAARVMHEALEASERRHLVHLAVAFVLGAGSSVLGFVVARWAMAYL